jgi:hypothetical protein
VDPVPDPLLPGKSSSAGNRTRASGSVDRNSDHWATEAVSSHDAELTPFQTHYFSENLEAPGFEPGPLERLSKLKKKKN